MHDDKAANHYREGKMHYRNGKLSNAERAFRKAVKINPGHVDAHNDLGNLYLQQGRPREAYNAYRKALKIAPEHPMLLNNVGNALMLQGRFEDARGWLGRAIAGDPQSAVAHYNLGSVLRSLGEHAAAAQSFKRALELDPGHGLSICSLGETLVELGEPDEAVGCFMRALQVNPQDQRAHLGLGKAYNVLGNLDRAVAAFEAAISINPNNAKCYSGLGRALEDHGDIAKAVSAVRKAIAIDPKIVSAYQILARNKKFDRDDAEFKAMESLHSSRGLSDMDKSHLGFSLGKACEDIGDFDRAMALVIESARLRRNLYDYSISAAEKQFASIKEFFSPEFFAGCADTGVADETPVFILGMPRSGTTLVEQILASHPDVCGAGELDDLAKVYRSIDESNSSSPGDSFPEGLIGLDPGRFSRLGGQYLERIRKHSASARFITDKTPHNFLRIGFIRAILPGARIIHCTRDPLDNCLSLFKTDFQKGHLYSYDLLELRRYYQLYRDLMAYWKCTLPGYIHEQNYEELVGDQEAQTRRLLRYCDLPWDESCLEFHQTRRRVATASNAQVNRPIYRDSVELWKRYEQHLEPLKPLIQG
jgi:tetratricopeptide (TPR) repeat protein